MNTNNSPVKIAYIMSRFPKLTETFILYEMLAVEVAGTPIELYPLLRAKDTDLKIEGANVWTKFIERFKKSPGEIKMHPEAALYVARAYFFPFINLPILLAQFYFLLRKPITYLNTLITVIRANFGSANFLLGVLSIFPKSVYSAYHMKRNGITHVHAHFANHPAAAAFIIHRLSGIPFSFTAHGADLQVDQHMLCEKISESAFTVTISNYNKQFMLEKCGSQHEDKVKVLYCGVDTNVFNRERGTQDTLSADTFNIVTIATFYEVKGHTYLINACQILKNQGVNFKCYLIGTGPLQAQLNQKVIDLGLQDHVIFYGQCTRQEIADILRSADLSVLPSIPTTSGRREGIPVSLMEAMASSTPVISSNISGIPELIQNGKNGILVPPKDSNALANAINKLYNNEKLRLELGQAARETILDRFDIYKNADELIKTIKKSQIYD